MEPYTHTNPHAAVEINIKVLHIPIWSHHNDKLTTKSSIKQNAERRNLIFKLIPLV
jgi:hypothetical protein